MRYLVKGLLWPLYVSLQVVLVVLMLLLQFIEESLYGDVKSDINLHRIIFGGKDVEDKTYYEELHNGKYPVDSFQTSKKGGDEEAFGILIPEEREYINDIVQGTVEKDS